MRLLQRTWISPLAAVAFGALAVSGIYLFFDARFTGIRTLHTWMGLVLVAAVLLHVMLHWRVLLGYLRKPVGLAALVAMLALTAGLVFAGRNEPRCDGDALRLRRGPTERAMQQSSAMETQARRPGQCPPADSVTDERVTSATASVEAAETRDACEHSAAGPRGPRNAHEAGAAVRGARLRGGPPWRRASD